MTTVLYADVLFIINFSMDFISLCITARLLSLRRRAAMYSVAAALGAAGATAVTAVGIRSFTEAAITVAMSVVMCFIAYGKCSVRALCGRSCALWGTGALLGGAVTVICSLGERNVIPGTDAADTDGDVTLPLFLGVFLVWLLVRFIRPHLSRTSAQISITYGDKSITVPALVDSGNLCADPFSGSPVLFISRPFAEDLLGANDTRAILSLDRLTLSDSLAHRIRAVPCSGMTGSKLLFAFRPDTVCVMPDKSPRDCVIAVCDFPSDHFKGLPALVPAAIL